MLSLPPGRAGGKAVPITLSNSRQPTEGRAEATFLFDPEAIRRADEPSDDVARLVWLLLSLVRTQEVSFAAFAGIFRLGDRTFKRDVAKLRRLGALYGFGLAPQRRGAVRLAQFEGERKPRHAAEANLADALGALVDALGEVIATDVRDLVQLEGSAVDRFLHVATPRLVAQGAVAQTYRDVRDAWTRRARVRFRYPARDGGALAERIVEPYRVSYHAGRYYLIGFDVRPRSGGWRQYALDRIAGPVHPAGTFTRRSVPQAYRGEDAVGLFKTAPALEVTIELSARVAAAVVARRWQAQQRVEQRPDGSALITFLVYDLGEAVRWAFGFGPDARIVAPPSAVTLAAESAGAMLALYAAEPGSLQTA